MTKKITTICCAVALLATTAATPALSQAKNFAGPSIAGYGAYVGHTVKSNYNDGTNTQHITDLGENDIEYGLDLGYSIPIDNNFLIGFGITHALNDTDAGKFLGVLKFKAKDHQSIYIQPTYAFNNNFAGFVKLSHHRTKGTVSLTDNVVLSGEAENTIGADTSSEKFKGTGYGFGLKGMVSQNIYLQAEVNYIDYKSIGGGSEDDVVNFKPETVSGIISIGYKF
jgi:opacity protein-like surface antigen